MIQQPHLPFYSESKNKLLVIKLDFIFFRKLSQFLNMEDIVEMRSDVVKEKSTIEEILREGVVAKHHVFKIAQDVTKNLRKIDQEVVSHLKAEALDELRYLNKLEEKIMGAMADFGGVDKIEQEKIIVMMRDLEKELESVNNYKLSMLVKETDTGLYTDAICLTNPKIKTSDISLSLETTKDIIHVNVKPTSGELSELISRSLIFSAKGMISGYLI